MRFETTPVDLEKDQAIFRQSELKSYQHQRRGHSVCTMHESPAFCHLFAPECAIIVLTVVWHDCIWNCKYLKSRNIHLKLKTGIRIARVPEIDRSVYCWNGASAVRKPGAHIKVDDLSHRYRRSAVDALERINLEINPCESVALIGRSGCGKSTLLHLVAGLTPASRGTIHIDGARVHRPSPRWIVMFQQAALYPWMSVSQNIALGLRFAGRNKEIVGRIPELLKLVELEDYAEANVQDLSGGQQQRVALARSLAVHPEVLLLDEPFSALDTFTRSTLQRDVRRIAKEIGITLVIVTHDINEAVLLADRCIVMSANPGRIRAQFNVDLSDEERFGGGQRVRECRGKLQSIFEDVVGAQCNSGVVGNAIDFRQSQYSGLSAAV